MKKYGLELPKHKAEWLTGAGFEKLNVSKPVRSMGYW